MLTTDQMKERVREFYERVIEQGDLDFADQVIADDAVELNPLSPDMGNDKKAALETLRMIHELSPDMKAEYLDMIVSGNSLATRARFTGTDSGAGWGSMMGAPATGKPFSIEGIDVVKFNDAGQFVEHYGLFDAGGMMMQLGLLPMPGGDG
jgi:predicted ester cyclase